MKEEPPDSQDPDPIGVKSQKLFPPGTLDARLPTAANSIDGGRGNDKIANKPGKLAPHSTIALSPGEVQRKCHDADAIAKMAPNQIAEVQRMAREWMSKHQR
jgi:hypothetical protein